MNGPKAQAFLRTANRPRRGPHLRAFVHVGAGVLAIAS